MSCCDICHAAAAGVNQGGRISFCLFSCFRFLVFLVCLSSRLFWTPVYCCRRFGISGRISWNSSATRGVGSFYTRYSPAYTHTFAFCFMCPLLTLCPLRCPFTPLVNGARAGTTTSLTACPRTCGWPPTRYLSPLCLTPAPPARFTRVRVSCASCVCMLATRRLVNTN